MIEKKMGYCYQVVAFQVEEAERSEEEGASCQEVACVGEVGKEREAAGVDFRVVGPGKDPEEKREGGLEGWDGVALVEAETWRLSVVAAAAGSLSPVLDPYRVLARVPTLRERKNPQEVGDSQLDQLQGCC